MRNVRLGLLWAIAIGLIGCQSPEYEAQMQMIVEPNETPTSIGTPTIESTSQVSPTLTPKAVAVTPTPTIERIYVPVYQNPIAPRKSTTIPAQSTEAQTKRETKPPALKPTENQTPVTSGSAIPELTSAERELERYKSQPAIKGSAIPEQSGNCKELRARGIENIDVAANPWSSRLDRDNDGIACESTNR